MRILQTLFLLSLALFCACAQGRTFTSVKGDTLEAEISSVTGENVRLQMPDRRIITVPFGDFIPADQAYIEQWLVADAQKRDGVFRVKLQEFRKNNDTDKGIVTTRTWDAGYRVTLTNLISRDLDGLTLQYCLYKFDAEFGGRDTGKGNISRATGEVKIPAIRTRGDYAAETKTLRMNSSKLHTDWYWAGGGKRRSTDDLKGIWLRVYRNGKLIFEHNSCPGASKEDKWPDDKLPVPQA